MTDQMSGTKTGRKGQAGPDRFIAQALDAVRDYSLLATGDAVLVGVSGGPDSVALLCFLMDVRQRFGLRLGVAHLNHCLRAEESDRDELFVRELAQRFGLVCHGRTLNVAQLAEQQRLSVEEAAREARYSFFRDVLDSHGYDKVALGHTLDDNAELVIMNLLRGSGLRGLGGIPPMRDGWIVRPLIRVTRQTLLAFLEDLGQSYVIDSTNAGDDYLRNRVRNTLIPMLEAQYNPGIKTALDRVSRIIREEDDWVDAQMDILFDKALADRGDTRVTLSLDSILGASGVVVRRLFRKAIQSVKGDLRRITFGHISDAVALAQSSAPGKSIDLPDRVRVVRLRNQIVFRKETIPLRELGMTRKKARRSRPGKP